MKRCAIVICAVAGFAVVSLLPAVTLAQTDKYGQTVPTQLQEQVERARSMRLPNSGRYDAKESVTLLQDALQKKPDYYRALYNLALAQAEANDYDKAKVTFEKAFEVAAKQNIRDGSIYNSAGWVAMRFGDYAAAEELLKKALELKDENQEGTNRAIYNNLGLVYFYTQRFDDARQYLKVAASEYGSASASDTLKLIEETERAVQLKAVTQ